MCVYSKRSFFFLWRDAGAVSLFVKQRQLKCVICQDILVWVVFSSWVLVKWLLASPSRRQLLNPVFIFREELKRRKLCHEEPLWSALSLCSHGVKAIYKYITSSLLQILLLLLVLLLIINYWSLVILRCLFKEHMTCDRLLTISKITIKER